MNMPMKQAEVMGYRNAMLVLTATRSWVGAVMSQSCGRARSRFVGMWDDCFDQLGDPELANIWGSFMRHLTIDGKATFMLGCSGCGRSSEDENILLSCLSAHQRGQKVEACGKLERWFDGEALWKADALAEAFADQMSLQGYVLPAGVEQHPSSGFYYRHGSSASTGRKLN